jgi:hypothetical protein
MEQSTGKVQQLDYLKQRQRSILSKIEDLEIALGSGLNLETYMPEDASLETRQSDDSKFARAFYDAEKESRSKGMTSEAPTYFMGSDTPAPAQEQMLQKSPSVASTVKSSVSVRSTGRRTEAQRKLDTQLLNSCYFGNTNSVLKIIRQGADPDFIDDRDGWGSLHYAARWGDCKMILAILAAGGDVNLRTFGKESPLHKAARWDQKDAAVLLLKRGALHHFKNGDGHKASKMTQDSDLAYLIDNFEQWCEEEIERIQNEERQAELMKRKAEMEKAQEERAREAEDEVLKGRRDFRNPGIGKK